jgi:hypothetical protein
MAHYAFLDDNNVVTQVIVGVDEWEERDGITDWEAYYGERKSQKCVRTSYNGNIRKNYAGIGYTYDDDRDAFIPPKPYPSWLLDEDTCRWLPPVPYPGSQTGDVYDWDEEAGSWILIQLKIESEG